MEQSRAIGSQDGTNASASRQPITSDHRDNDGERPVARTETTSVPQPRDPETPSTADLPPALSAVPPEAHQRSVVTVYEQTPRVPTHPVVEQVAPAVIALARAEPGEHRLTVHLRPEALGQVEIRIERIVDTPIRIVVMADRAETLTSLRQDRAQLEDALAQAGIPLDGGAIQFRPIQSEAVPTFASNPDPQAGFGQGGDNRSADQDRRGWAQATPAPPTEPSHTDTTRRPTTRPPLGGVNIMA